MPYFFDLPNGHMGGGGLVPSGRARKEDAAYHIIQITEGGRRPAKKKKVFARNQAARTRTKQTFRLLNNSGKSIQSNFYTKAPITPHPTPRKYRDFRRSLPWTDAPLPPPPAPPPPTRKSAHVLTASPRRQSQNVEDMLPFHSYCNIEERRGQKKKKRNRHKTTFQSTPSLSLYSSASSILGAR